MEIPNWRGILGMLFLWSLCCVTASSAQSLRGRPHGRGYLRAADVTRQCQSVLSSASELVTITRSDASSLMSGLPDADWHQDAGDAPLMPVPGADGDSRLLDEEATTQLATLTLTHVDMVMDGQGQRGRLALNVSGVLSLTINRNGWCSQGCSSAGSKYDSMDPHRQNSPDFKLRPGVSKLDILLEGVFTETKSSSGFDGDGERVLCMVGDALLPVRGSNSTAGPWDWAKNNNVGDSSSSSFEPPVMADGNIVFTLRFPKWQTMTTRAMLGELTSTSAKSDKAYFDAVRVVSHGNHFSSDGYQYRPREELTAAAAAGCSTRPFFCDDDDDDEVSAGNNNNCAGELSEDVPVCDILRAGEYGVLAVVPNWKCGSNEEEFCGRLGPFLTGAGRAVNTTGRAFTGFAIAAQAIRCTGLDANGTAQVSAVFRAVPPWEDRLTAARRTGLGGMTLSAEGVWSASTRRLCMVACLGTGGGDKACRHRVSLFFPTTFSLTRRGVVTGQITSTDGSYFPLSFQRALDPGQTWNKASRPDEPLRMAYGYKKIDQAMELLIRSSKRSRLSSSLVAVSLISYPSPTKRAGAGGGTADDDDDDGTGILAEDLGLNFRVVGPKPQQGLPEWIKGQFFELQILSIGPLVRSKVHYRFDEGFQLQSTGRSGMQLRGVQNGMGTHNGGGVEVQQQILNVSAAFEASSRSSSGPWHRPVISLEGVYNPSDGRMHLIGCRDVEAPWRVLYSKTRGTLQSGMDCSMEVKVEYPPTTLRWLFSPAAKVYISSTRAADDPLRFDRAELKATATSYPSERYSSNAFLIAENAEGILCVAILCASVAASLAQLRHIKSRPDVAPYVSLAMLGAQALGHGATLVADARMLPAWPWPRPRYGYYRDDYYSRGGRLLRWPDMGCAVKALALAALLLTLRLAHKVRRARARAPGRVPGGDRGCVLLASLGVHLGGLLFVLAVPWLTTYGTAKPTLYQARQGTAAASLVACAVRAERYVALVLKDWFLLPQVIGNALWRVNCRPLRKAYYAGVTGMWLLPRVYGFLGPAVNNMYYYSHPDGAQDDDAMDFYAKVSAVVVPLVAAALAVSVYVQQRWNYVILGWAMGSSSKQKKLQHAY